MSSLGRDPIQYNLCPHKRWKFRCRDVQTERAPCENEGRGPGNASTSQGVPEIASRSPEAAREAWSRLSLTASEGSNSWQHLDHRLPATGTLRWHISAVSAPSVWYFVAAAGADWYTSELTTRQQALKSDPETQSQPPTYKLVKFGRLLSLSGP